MSKSPTQLSLERLRGDGYQAAVVEHWNAYIGIRQDLFGFIDILAVRGTETLAVQATSASNVSSRVHKIADSPHVAAVRDAGWRIVVWGWAKKKNRWVLAREVDCS